jgi:UDP-2,3-diacylglucosamine pyrophosphatase LpxH
MLYARYRRAQAAFNNKYASLHREVKVMSDGPVLVISDTHLGFQDESAKRFQNFTEFLTEWVRNGEATIEETDKKTGKKTSETLADPQRIILLGDMLDLWISRDSNTVRPYLHGFSALNSLIALHREIIYLVGNHDWILNQYADKRDQLPSSVPFTLRGDSYPPPESDGRMKGERIGRRTYLFLHGHQFDPFFRHKSMLRFGDFMGFSSANAGELKWFTLLGGLVFFTTLLLVLSPLRANWLPPLLTAVAPSLNDPVFAVITLFFGWFIAVLVFFGVLWLFNMLARAYYGISLWPGFKWKWNLLSSVRGTKLHEKIGTFHFNSVARKIDAEIIIIGHTHLPRIYTPRNWPDKLCINCGSWIEQRQNAHDTFVYIDDRGPRLLQWHDDGRRYVSQVESRLL